jgi:hypothetical protein
MAAMVRNKAIAFFIAFLLVAGSARADDAAQAWDALRGDGDVALIRHASAPGAPGDPAGFRLDDCKTQRNLGDKGRAEARALGEKFRAQKVKVGKVISSQWCRCRQTAELMDIGPVEAAPTFNNAFRGGGERDKLTAGARALIAAWRGPGTLVVATHGQNILALLGFRPVEGEIVVVAPDPGAEKKMRLIGRIAPVS